MTFSTNSMVSESKAQVEGGVENMTSPPVRTGLSIVIPAYNEADRIGATIRELESNIPEIAEIIVVADGTDNTPEVAISNGHKVRVLRFDKRLGQGGAVFQGFRAGRGNVIGFVDADGSTPWYEVKKICSLVDERNRAVFGSRWVNGSRILRKEPFRNIVGGRVFHYLAVAILGIETKDFFCGAKAFTYDIAMELTKRITIQDRTFNLAIAYHLYKMGIIPLEVGIDWMHVDRSKLPVRPKTVFIMFLTLLGLRIASNSNNEGVIDSLVNFRQRIRFY
jgi:glycosyltransferase involved in cell wall biosynthesis